MLALLLSATLAAAQAAPVAEPARAPVRIPEATGTAGSPLESGLQTVEAHFIQQIPRDRLETMAFAALLEKLDPYSHYLDPAEMDAFRSELDATFAGIGVNLYYEDPSGYPLVSYLLRGGVAGKSDLRRGDLLLSVNGTDLKGRKWEQVSTLLRGREGTPVTLRLRRSGVAEPITLELKRVQIDTPSVRPLHRDENDQPDWWLDRKHKLGYLRLASVSGDSAAGVAAALRELRRGGARGLVMDLRDCAGGLMDGAIEVSDQFLTRGRILSIRQREQDRHFDAKRGGDTKMKLAVLTNGQTISSCEMIVGALADNGRATAIGERTFGQGGMQVMYTLGDGRGGMVMSTGTFQRPNGKTIHKHDVPEGSPDVGIAPQVEVKTSEAEHEAWLEYAEKSTGLQLMSPDELGAPPADRVLTRATQWLISNARN